MGNLDDFIAGVSKEGENLVEPRVVQSDAGHPISSGYVLGSRETCEIEFRKERYHEEEDIGPIVSARCPGVVNREGVPEWIPAQGNYLRPRCRTLYRITAQADIDMELESGDSAVVSGKTLVIRGTAMCGYECSPGFRPFGFIVYAELII